MCQRVQKSLRELAKNGWRKLGLSSMPINALSPRTMEV